MVSYASIPLSSKKVYIPLHAAGFFDIHSKADWDANKNDVFCTEHNVSFNETTQLKPIMVNDNTVYYSGVDHPVPNLARFEDLELNREYA